MRTQFLLAMWFAAGCGGPADAVSMGPDALCGYVEAVGSPVTNDSGGCWRVVVTSPDGARVTAAGALACDVDTAGQRCLIVAPRETFQVWHDIGDGARRPLVPHASVPCDTACL